LKKSVLVYQQKSDISEVEMAQKQVELSDHYLTDLYLLKFHGEELIIISL